MSHTGCHTSCADSAPLVLVLQVMLQEKLQVKLLVQVVPLGGGGPVRLDYSFDRLIIASGGSLFYWDGSVLSRVTDGDLGTVLDACWISGYTLTTDGTSLIVTELNDPAGVNPLKYGSAEADPDPVRAVARLTTEAYALGAHTIEAFQNVGGETFPFARIEGAQVPKGVAGTRAWCYYADTLAFVGSGRNEPPGVYLMGSGAAAPLHTREIQRILAGYSAQQLAGVVCESRAWEAHQHLIIRLPDQALVYDLAASKALGESVWHVLSSGIDARGEYRASAPVWCYGKWIVGDTQSQAIGYLSPAVSTHWGAMTGWELTTAALYNDGKAFIHADHSNLITANAGAPSRMRSAISQYQCGRPKNAKTKIAITITQSRNAVPQRTWIRLCRCTFSGVSSSRTTSANDWAQVPT